MKRGLLFFYRLLRLLLTPWRIPKALFIRLRYVLRLMIGLPGDFRYEALQLVSAMPALGGPPPPAVTPEAMAEMALRLEKLEAIAHFQRLRGYVGTGSARIDETAPRPVSLLIDMRITQSDQRERGISRYATALALTLPGLLPPGSVSYLINPELAPPTEIEAMRRLGRIVEGADQIAELESVTHFLQTCLFDLMKSVDELFPTQLARHRPQLSAILYDLIPWLFREQYLGIDWVFQRYAFHFANLPQLDKLYAISECARQDALTAAHLPADRVQTIFGGIDETRWIGQSAIASSPIASSPIASSGDGEVVVENRDGERSALRAPYWLYVGGDDFRKNVEGAIEAFAQVKHALSPDIRPMLAIACSIPKERREFLIEFAQARGLAPGEDLVITGYISDADLAACYRGAFATVFPSLYEGLGLPILESYHFGVPALAGDNSSLRELTHPDCRFDSGRPDDIARAMIACHRDPAVSASSLAYGREMLQKYNWRNAATAIADDVLGK